MKKISLFAFILAVPAAYAQNFQTELITEQPKGELLIFQRHGTSCYAYGNSYRETEQNGDALRLVLDADGTTFYMQNLVNEQKYGTWVKGTIGEDGKLHLPLYQYIEDNIAIGVLNKEKSTFVTDTTAPKLPTSGRRRKALF